MNEDALSGTDLCGFPSCRHVRWRHTAAGCTVKDCGCSIRPGTGFFRPAIYAGPKDTAKDKPINQPCPPKAPLHG